MTSNDQSNEQPSSPPLQFQVTGDQPALIGEGGLDVESPMDRTKREIDMIVAALRRAFVADAGVGVHFERLARQISNCRTD